MPYIPSSLMVKCFGVKNTRFGVPFEVTVVKHKNNDTYKQTQCYIPVEPYERQKKRCPCCHKVCQGYDTKREDPSSWRTSDFGTVPVFLTYTPSRIKCPERTFLSKTPHENGGREPHIRGTWCWTASDQPKAYDALMHMRLLSQPSCMP